MSDLLWKIEVPRQQYDPAADQDELDPSTAFLEQFGPGQGQLTLVCWGRAWTHYWSAMGPGKTIMGFLLSASTGYIVGKLMLGRDVMLKRAEARERRWLMQLVDALKRELQRGPEL